MRGFNAQGRARQVFEFVGEHRLDFVCLQETIKAEFSSVDLRKFKVGKSARRRRRGWHSPSA